MQRRRPASSKADAIFVADLHLTDTTPASRTDDYIAAQEQKLQWLQTLSTAHDGCPIVCSGDVFDKWKASPWLLQWAYHYLPAPFITIPGNHDLPMHSMNRYDESALAVLEAVGKVQVLKDVPAYLTIGSRRIAILHELIFPTGSSITTLIDGAKQAAALLMDYEDVDVILTGDNHMSFVEKLSNRILVNPGSMMRSTAAQTEHRPAALLYYAKQNTVTWEYFPTTPDVLNRKHIDAAKDRDDRITTYIERMHKSQVHGLSFRQNLEAYFQANSTPKKIRDIIWDHYHS